MLLETIVIAIILCLAFGSFWVIKKKRDTLKASKIVKEVYDVWAAQGPFQNGDASAKAMRYATLAVRGYDSLADSKFKEAISLHARAYNNDPSKWEAFRKEALSCSKSENFEEQLKMVNRIAENDNALDNFGNRLIKNESKESKDLIVFLNEAYKSRKGRNIENSGELGYIFAQIYSESFENPNEEFYSEFLQLHERLKKSKSDDGKNF
jgi:hypothetical protein